MGKVTESIYSSKTVTVPLADVVFISHRGSCSIVVMKGTTYDSAEDEYNNPVVIEASEVADFSAAWCRYRYELESETIQDLSPQAAPRVPMTDDELRQCRLETEYDGTPSEPFVHRSTHSRFAAFARAVEQFHGIGVKP